MSPILTRPVREQFEHDRIIRLLEARYRRKFEVAINPGAEQNASVPNGDMALFPDLVLFTQERGRRLQGTVEVETGESINTLEALSQWSPFGRLQVPFFLYVPPSAIDTVRRLCAEHEISVAEIWTYHTAIDQIRFTMVHRAPEFAPSARKGKAASRKAKATDLKGEAAAASPERPETPAVPRTGQKRSTKKTAEPKRAEKRRARARADSAPPARAARSVARPRTAPRSAAHPARKAATSKTVKSVKRR